MFNHVNDPNYFNDAIEMFAFDYDWYTQDLPTIDDYGEEKYTYSKKTIHGSIQSQGATLQLDSNGNRESHKYNFYCRSIYRIKNGDFIHYQNRWLHVDFVQDYDEWGVRNASLTMVNLNNYKDFQESQKFLDGDELV